MTCGNFPCEIGLQKKYTIEKYIFEFDQMLVSSHLLQHNEISYVITYNKTFAYVLKITI